MSFIKFVIGLPLFVLLLVFAFTNNDLVTLKIWPTDIEVITSLSVTIVFCLFWDILSVGYLHGCLIFR